MTAQTTDRIWTTRDGVSPQSPGELCDFLTIDQIAAGLSANVIDPSVINGLAAFVTTNETTTSLAYNAGTSILTYTDEDGVSTNLDLSALTTDVYVTGATLAGSVLTLSDNDAGTPDVVVDLAAFATDFTDNADGTYLFTAGDGATLTVDTRAASNPITDAGGYFAGTNVEAALQEIGAAMAADIEVSSDANNDITAGSDGGAFLDVSALIQSADPNNDLTLGSDGGLFFDSSASETTTTFAQAATGVITYTDEDGGASTANVVSGSANQILSAGADGGAFAAAPTTQLP